jgi:hypothetical protein
VGAALYIALETMDPAVENVLDGKALSRAEGELAGLARRLGVRPLMEFFSMSPEDFEADVAQFNPFGSEARGPIHEEQWFSAQEGLVTVRALLGHLQAQPQAFPGAEAARSDLEDFAHVLEEAGKRGIRWHLSVDY